MKNKIQRILKYSVLGFLGLIIFVVFISIVFSTPKPTNELEIEEVSSEETEVIEEVKDTAQIEDKNQETEALKPEPKLLEYQYYEVVNVVDGDTIKISINNEIETLRLIGIDTPETVDPRKPVQCFGKEASNKAKELLSGKKVRIEKDSTQGERDKYGRLLVYIHRNDGLFFNKYMIEQGYAFEYTYQTPYKYQYEFKEAEKYAQNNKVGLWSSSTCNGDPDTSTDSSAQNDGNFYTSSHYSAKYYYPEDCKEWESLSKIYLKSFNTLDELLDSYSRTLSPQCN